MTLVYQLINFAKMINLEIIVIAVVLIVIAAILADVWSKK